MPSVAKSLPEPDPRAPKPFLKWVGGKRQLLEQFAPLLPKTFGASHEPVVGGAARFFDLRLQRPDLRATLSDVNTELVDCYRAVRDDVDGLLAALKAHRHEEDHYYTVRGWNPAELTPLERAARTIFLNKTGFNGLYRVNKSGQFNVPFGRYDKPNFLDERNLRACAGALASTKIVYGDFSNVLEYAEKGDFVYFDPPYVPVSATADFTAYIPGGFGEREQTALAEAFTKLAKRKVNVMLSNSDTPWVRERYKGFEIHTVSASRSVNSKGSGRGKTNEILVRCVP